MMRHICAFIHLYNRGVKHMKTINIRRSIRKFIDKPVEDNKVEKLLRAGMQAPSAGNQQPWEFVVVVSTEMKEKISKMSPYAGAAKDSPLIIVVLGNTNRMRFPENMEQDLGACTQNILLEAVEQGLGATWMSVHPQEDRVKSIKETLELPDNIKPYNIIIAGYPKNKEDNKFVDRYEAARVHYSKYSK